MKYLLKGFLFALFLLFFQIIAKDVLINNFHPIKQIKAQEKIGWTLTFQDEFEGTSLNPSKWNDRYSHEPQGGRVHGNELQYYTPVSLGNHIINNGILRLRAENKETLPEYPYSSAMIASWGGKFFQEYGYFEIKAKLPKGKGLWPAFWLMPHTEEGAPWPPEIDIMEYLGHETNKVYFAHHISCNYPEIGPPFCDADSGKYLAGFDFSDDFHTFAMEWSENEIVWYVDGIEVFRSTKSVPRGPMYILVNLAVGGDWPGSPDESTIFPKYFDIDYIRAYKKQDIPALTIPGDFNGDEIVNLEDFNRIIVFFSNPYTIYDYNKLVENFGN